MAYKVFIDGQEGTTGLRIHDYLHKRRDIEILTIEEKLRKDIEVRLRRMEEAEITFLCLPDEASREIAALAPAHTRILDASTAHRTTVGWSYGLPELGERQRAEVANATRVAVPGCHATGFLLLVKPLMEAGFTDGEYPFTCFSITGYSGGGKKMIAEYEAEGRPAELDSPRQYGLQQRHKHLPEMMHVAGLSFTPSFSPVVGDFSCGMVVTVPLQQRLLQKKVSVSGLHDFFAERYRDCAMIDVRQEPGPESGYLGANQLAEQNTVEIFVYGSDENIMLAARYDNLGKGASGGAVQCMNLMLGVREEEGLI